MNINETRNIKVDLKTAREWFKSDSPILVTLAKQAFTEKELTPLSFNDIRKLTGPTCRSVEEEMLATLAAYYRKPTDNFKGSNRYFICKNHLGEWIVLMHTNVSYPGLAYYVRKEDAEEALDIFKREIQFF